MSLWTDIIDPATLTGYARASFADYEARKGSLARWLPNRYVSDIVVRLVRGQTGLVDVAKFRAYDAPPEIGKRKPGPRVTLELPALGQDIPVSEYDRLRAAGGVPSDEAVLAMIQSTTRDVVRAVADAIELQRGGVLVTGKATIDQDNYQSDDDFGRPGTHSVSLAGGDMWTSPTADRLAALESVTDLFANSGDSAGSLVMTRATFRRFAAGDQFKTSLVGGASRPATRGELDSYVDAAGLPPITIYDRKVSDGGVITSPVPDGYVLVLPEPVDPDDWQGTDLGSTTWGRTLSSLEADWAIPDADQPGIVAGVWKHDKVPHGAEVLSDAIGMAILANGEKSVALKAF